MQKSLVGGQSLPERGPCGEGRGSKEIKSLTEMKI